MAKETKKRLLSSRDILLLWKRDVPLHLSIVQFVKGTGNSDYRKAVVVLLFHQHKNKNIALIS